MTEKRYEIASIADMEEQARGGWAPIRKHFGVESFGINAWTAHEAGGTVIPEHDEVSSGHEEIYVVMSGHAAFTVDGDEVDAPQGSVVFVRDPAAKRGATAREAGTTVLTAGAEPGEVYQPRAWEINAQIPALFDQGELEKAKKMLTDALPRYKDKGGILYNIACTEALLGETDEALGHLRESLAAQPSYAENARDDPDFESIRSDPRFAELVGA
jgi:quercetin dioxygenase-like cupin family protein